MAAVTSRWAIASGNAVATMYDGRPTESSRDAVNAMNGAGRSVAGGHTVAVVRAAWRAVTALRRAVAGVRSAAMPRSAWVMPVVGLPRRGASREGAVGTSYRQQYLEDQKRISSAANIT